MQPSETTPTPVYRAPHSRRITLVIFLILLCGFLAFNFFMVAPYLLAVLMGGILAVLSMPLHRRLLARGVGKKLSASLVVLFITVAVIGPLATLGTIALQQGIEFGQKLASEGSLSLDVLARQLSKIRPLQSLVGNADQIQNQIMTQTRAASGQASKLLLAALGGLPDKGLQAVLALLTCFTFLTDGRRFMAWLDDKIPMDRDVRTHLYDSFRDTAISVIWATIAAALVQSAILFVAYLVLGVPGAFLAAGATFIFAWIPVVGSTPVWVVGAIYLFMSGSLPKAVAMVAFGLVTSVADNFVRPMVLKGRSALHPLVSLVSIFGGIQMFGLFGVFFGPILTAVLLSLLDVWPMVAKRFQLVPGRPEEVAPPEAPVKVSRSA